MIAGTGHPALAAAIDREHELDDIWDIHTEGLDAWAKRYGFTRRELAMVQPQYAPAPTRDDHLRMLHESLDAWTLECGRLHEPVRSFWIAARGNREGTVRFRVFRRHPFVRCFSHDSTSGTAWDTEPRPFRFTRRLVITPPQEILQSRLDRMRLGDCVPQRGVLPRAASVRVEVDAAGLHVGLETEPRNEEAEACLTAKVRRELADFKAGRWSLRARRQGPVLPWMSPSLLADQLKAGLSAAGTACWSPDAPQEVRAVARVEKDRSEIAVAALDGSAAFRACVEGVLRDELERRLRIERSDVDGESITFMRIDASASVQAEVQVFSPEQRQRWIERRRARAADPR